MTLTSIILSEANSPVYNSFCFQSCKTPDLSTRIFSNSQGTMIPVVVLVVIVGLAIIYIYNVKSKAVKIEGFNSPFRLPVLGNLLEIANPDNILDVSFKHMHRLGPNWVFYLGYQPNLVITDPHLVELVLGSSTLITKSEEYRAFHKWFGDGLLTSTGSKWHHFRKVLTPGFHYKILDEFVDIFDKAGNTLIEKLQKDVGKQSIDIISKISFCTLDIICETAMGVTINSQNDPKSVIVIGMETMCDIMYHKILTYLRFSDFLYRHSKYHKMEEETLKMIKNNSYDITEKRRKLLAEKKVKAENNDKDIGIKKKSSFLDILLQATVDGRPLTNEEIREQVDTFMFEGHDTSAAAISFALYEISRHNNIQNNIFNEIVDVLCGDGTFKLTYNNLQDMKYLEMVIKETMRLYPSVPAFGRHLTESVTYEGKVLPKNLQVIITPYIMHRREDLFPNPEVFDPERFSFENSRKRHPYSYIPFSAGPRNCIGQKFAMLELKAIISKVLYHYELLPAVPAFTVHCTDKVTIKPTNGIKLQLKKRNNV